MDIEEKDYYDLKQSDEDLKNTKNTTKNIYNNKRNYQDYHLKRKRNNSIQILNQERFIDKKTKNIPNIKSYRESDFNFGWLFLICVIGFMLYSINEAIALIK